jgi:hypothetical protein
VVKLKYVKWVEEILELNYGILNIIVFLCNWVHYTLIYVQVHYVFH